MTVKDFKTLGIPQELLLPLEKMNISSPTPIQEKAIPVVLSGSDILASAQTGTGKTLAYLLPILAKMHNKSYQQALVLAPTRELAEQIKVSLLKLLGRKHQDEVCSLIGGAPIFDADLVLVPSLVHVQDVRHYL